MESFETSEGWAPTNTTDNLLCIWMLFRLLYVCLWKTLLIWACSPKCPSVSPLNVFAFSEQNQGEDSLLQELSPHLAYRWHVADTDPWTPGMSGGAPVSLKGRFPPSYMEGETVCFPGRVVLQGTDFWRSSVHCTVSHSQSTSRADQQMLAGLHHGQAVSGPQWEPPWPQTRTPAPALSPCGDVLQDAASFHFLQAHTCAKCGMLAPCSAQGII